MESEVNWWLTKGVGVVLGAGATWGLWKSWQLLRGPSGGHARLVSPVLCRVAGLLFAALPIYVILSGRATTWRVVLGCGLNLLVAFSLWQAGAVAGDEPPDAA
jgi:hypothetical protein